jgi:mono/diheme cytochrome c family protein
VLRLARLRLRRGRARHLLAAGAAVLTGVVGVTVAGQTSVSPSTPTSTPRRAAVSAPVANAARRTPAPVAAHASTPVLSAATQTELVTTYCATCHSERAKAGGLVLANFSAMRAHEQPEVVERMIRKLRAGMMPPAGAKRPDAATIAALTTALESRMDEHAAANPNPGWRPFQRLNRAEYTRAVKDLLGIEVDVTAFLPADTMSHGFDNVADVQGLSPTLLEGYLRAASQISRLAVGDRDATPAVVTYKVGRTMSQMRHVEGAPLGTRGGVSVNHIFPADGEYVIGVNLHNEPLGGLYGRTTMSVMELTEEIDVSIDGERVAVIPLNERMSESDQSNSLDPRTARVYVTAGPHRVSAAFVQRFEAPPNDLLIPVENTLADVSMSFGVTLLPHLRDMTVHGPYRVTGVSDTVSRRSIFSCRPTTAAEEPACAQQIVRSLATRAFRGPVPAEDLDTLMAFYRKGRGNGDFEHAIRYTLQAILASPRFAFRLEEVPATARAGQSFRLNDQDLASRLSFFLWGTVPDAELVKVTAQGGLRTAAGLAAQVSRMLADPRSEALATRFAAQWLRLQDLDKIIPDYLQYPHYDDTLAWSLRRETELFVDSLLRERRSVLDLLDADYTFVNERVAIHYGIANVTGSQFRRVTIADPNRRGILGHGSILALTSIADRTSPVLRGKWIMEVLLGSPPPPPPPNVPALDDVKDVKGGRTLSVRERMEEHRKNPACTSCHKVIDPLGLALENFDVTGAWRIKDNEVAVDPVGVLYDGMNLDGPVALRAALKTHKDAVLLSFTEALMTYATGRRVEPFDMPAIRRIIRDAAAQDNTVAAFVQGVAASQAFRMSRAELPETATTTVAPAAGRH